MILLNEARPKYEKLNELFELPILTNIRFTSKINIIVDLKEILKKFFRPDIELSDRTDVDLAKEITSDIINTIGHYRNYFYKNNKYSDFYILYSFGKCVEMLKEYPNYKKDFYETYFNPEDRKFVITQKAAKAVKEIASAIPHCKFVDTTKHDEFVYAKLIRDNTADNEPNLILSNDDVFFQLVNDHTFILDIKGIKSDLITKNNALDILTKKEGNQISYKSLPLILALTGSKRYSFNKIENVAILRAVAIVEKLIKDGKAQDEDLIEFPIKFSLLDPNNKMDKIILDNKDNIVKNYEFVRADKFLYANRLTMLAELVDGETSNINILRSINDKIFVQYPINIEMLFKGEE